MHISTHHKSTDTIDSDLGGSVDHRRLRPPVVTGVDAAVRVTRLAIAIRNVRTRCSRTPYVELVTVCTSD